MDRVCQIPVITVVTYHLKKAEAAGIPLFSPPWAVFLHRLLLLSSGPSFYLGTIIFDPNLTSMKTKTLLLSGAVLCINAATAQSLRHAVALPYIGPGAYSRQQTDPFSFSCNQAALAQVRQPAAGVYGERRFLLAATSYYSLAAVFPSKLGKFGLQLNYGGFKNFNENKIGLAYARSLGPKLDVGIQFNYYGYRVPAYAGATAINFEAGAIMHFSDKFNGGIQVYNPVGGKLGKTAAEKLASVYKMGFGYDASVNFFAGIEIIKEEDRPVNCIGSVLYRFAGSFFARMGILTESTSAFAGAGWRWNNLRVDVSASYHPQLGFSPGIMLVMNGKAKDK